MKRIVIVILVFSASVNAFCQKRSAAYISENFVLLGVKAIRVNDDMYIREICAKDFKANDNSVIEGFAIGDEMFIDNGQDNDKKANDGIYTSVDTYQMKDQKKDIVVLSDKVVFGINFKFGKELEKYLSKNRAPGNSGAKIRCDIISCTCTECQCIACYCNWEQSQSWCFTTNDCMIEIGFDY